MGMFHRRGILNDLNYDINLMHGYGSTCLMDSHGFINGTCSAKEVAIAPDPAWTAIGKRLAQQWLAETSSPYFVTTCIKSPKENSGWVALVFLAGYNTFPLCQPPSGPQEIAGMAMSETAIRDEYPNGAYTLTVFADKTMNESAVDTSGITRAKYSNPLGDRYRITWYAYATVLDITSRIDSSIKWWNIGRKSKKIVTMTWDRGHDIANGVEPLTIQLVLVILANLSIISDFHLTYKGLKGFLAGKPVMTYDLGSGLERRRLPTLLTVFGYLPAILYPDVARIYFETPEGGTFWLMSSTLIGAFFVCTLFMSVGVVQSIPCPSKHLVSFSSVLFSNMVMPIIINFWMSQYAIVADTIDSFPFELAFNISGVLRPSGAYSNVGVVPVITIMAPPSAAIVLFCLLVSILFSGIHRKIKHGTFLLNIEWTSTNSFLDQCGMPRWITGLPLDQHNMVKIGNKMFCKPSLQTILGYASVRPISAVQEVKAGTNSDNEATTILISVYALIPVLLSLHRWLPKWASPAIFGYVTKNKFVAGNDNRLSLERFENFKGTCVN
ncbi:hypothetical protein AC1031_007843 [Aphanomyces cochlioides]|nr:hypothetical protein AC1031_007843 [Aphanomyces cochlioides]